MGLPPLVLAGEPVVEHTYTDYDAQGRVAHTRTVRQDWGELDIVLARLMVEWDELQAADRCPGCGGSRAEHYGKTYADYDAGFDMCPAAEKMERSRDAYRKSAAHGVRKNAGEHPDQVDRWFVHPKVSTNHDPGDQDSARS
jgi:hypothetical protein